ncbi:unnamed protein product, partial [marine sediment metagenome]
GLNSPFRRNANSYGSFFGGFGGPGGPVKGQDLIYELSVNLEDIVQTNQKTIAYNLGGHHEQIKVKIPAGIGDGKKLRLTGKGQPGPEGGTPGNLYIKVKVLAHPVFTRDGDDLYLTREVTFSDAVLGASIEVPTIDGKRLSLKVPAGSQNGSKLRLKGYGMPRTNGRGRGYAYVKLSITVPKKLDKRQRELVERLKESGL